MGKTWGSCTWGQAWVWPHVLWCCGKVGKLITPGDSWAWGSWTASRIKHNMGEFKGVWHVTQVQSVNHVMYQQKEKSLWVPLWRDSSSSLLQLGWYRTCSSSCAQGQLCPGLRGPTSLQHRQDSTGVERGEVAYSPTCQVGMGAQPAFALYI